MPFQLWGFSKSSKIFVIRKLVSLINEVIQGTNPPNQNSAHEQSHSSDEASSFFFPKTKFTEHQFKILHDGDLGKLMDKIDHSPARCIFASRVPIAKATHSLTHMII